MKRQPSLFLSFVLIAVSSLTGAAPSSFAQKPKTPALIHPKVIIVVYFELGRDTGDQPGELQFWVERDHLDRTLDVPGMSRPIRMNADGSEIAMAVGPGNIRPAMNLMAFGLDPRFDLTRSYWLLNGIAGVSPKDAPLASAIWTDYVINGDLLHEIDARELPPSWPDGFYALDTTRPDEQNPHRSPEENVASWPKEGAHTNANGSVVRLNPALLNWAFDVTRDTKLPETDQMRSLEARYAGFPAAQKTPRVSIGANLAAETFWHGAKMDDWAHRWVRYATDGKATYVSTAMNDSGSLAALWSLTRSHRADWNRALVLRTASNFDMQPADESAEQSANSERHGGYTAYEPALESAYRVGSQVVKALLSNWKQYETNIAFAPAQ